jgi:DNA-binding MarR family transcriptional regulator
MNTPGDFFVVHRWMGSVLNLKGNNRTVFAILWGFCQGGNSYRGSAEYVAGLAEMSRSGVFSAYAALEAMEYIERYGNPTNISVTDKARELIGQSKGKTVTNRPSPEIGLDESKNWTDQSRNWTPINTKEKNKKRIIEEDVEKKTPPPPAAIGFKMTREQIQAQLIDFSTQLRADRYFLEQLCMSHKVTLEMATKAFEAFHGWKLNVEDKGWRDYTDFRKNFYSYVPGWKQRTAGGTASNGVGVIGQRK